MTTARDIVDAEKPLFDYVRYGLQLTTLGVGIAAVITYEWRRGPNFGVGDLFTYASIAIFIYIFFALAYRFIAITNSLADLYLPLPAGRLHRFFVALISAAAPVLIARFIAILLAILITEMPQVKSLTDDTVIEKMRDGK